MPSTTTARRLAGALLLLAAALPARAQSSAPASVLDAARAAGASEADAQALASAVSAETALLRASNTGASDNFGYSVSVSGSMAVVGAYLEDGPTNATADAGAAYVFERQTSGAWTETAVLRASNAGTSDFFGRSVSISGGVAVVGANGEDGPTNATSSAGAAYVFERQTSGAWTETAVLRASNAGTSDNFGSTVSVSGGMAVVGANGEDGPTNATSDAGAAYVFERQTGGAWTETAVLRASNAQSFDNFSVSVSVSGGVAVIGANQEDGPTNATGASGAAYVFERQTGGAWTETAVLRASNAEAFDQFGRSVSVSGSVAVVGANLEDGPTNATSDAGAAYVFERQTGGAWSETAVLRASNADAGDAFGNPVSVSGGVAVVGAFLEDGPSNTTSASGAAYVFERQTSGAWAESAVLRASSADAGDAFGFSVSVSGGVVVVGSYGEDGPSNATGDSGAAYVLGVPITQGALFNPSSAADDGRGYRLLGVHVQNYTVTDLAGLNLVQGIPAGTPAASFPAQYPAAPGPNLLTGYVGGTAGFGGTAFTVPTASDVLAPGRGFFWYLYDRDITPTPTAFGGGTSRSRELTNFVLSASGPVVESNVQVSFADNAADNFQMLANPFARPLAVSGITVSGGTIQGGDVFQAFNPNGNTYVLLTSGSRLAVWQGVFAELVPSAPGGAVTVTYAYGSTDTGAAPPFYGRSAATGTAAARPSVRLALTGRLASGTAVADEAAVVRLDAAGEAGWDALDAGKLTPPMADRALVAPMAARDGVAVPLAVDTRPLDAASEVPLALATTEAGAFTLTWTADLPEGWTATLLDGATGATVDLATATDLAFTTDASQAWAPRFTLRLAPRGATAGEGSAAGAFVLSAARPNPTTGTSSLVLTLDRPQRIRAVLVDALGRDVAILHDGEAAGALALSVDGRALAPGVYVVRVSGETAVQTQRLTVAR